MLKKILVVSALNITLMACATQKPISPSVAKQIKGQSFSVAVESSSFYLLSAGKMAIGAVFGAVGMGIAASAMVSDGKAFATKNKLKSPTPQLSQALGRFLKRKYGLQKRSPAKLRLLLKEVGWGLTPGADANSYKVHYSVLATLTSVDNKQVLSSFSCKGLPEAQARKHRYQAFMKNPSLVKQELQRNKAYCLAQFKKNF